MFLVDSHCHLNMLEGKIELREILRATNEYNVKYLQTICTNKFDIAPIIEIIENNQNIFGSIGIHPNQTVSLGRSVSEASEQNLSKYYEVLNKYLNTYSLPEKADLKKIIEDILLNDVQIFSAQQLIALADHPKIIGLGETGLDYYYTEETMTNKKAQINSFASHIEAGAKSRLPIIVHTREAEQDTTDIITSEMKNRHFTGVIHCFTASKDFAKKMLDIDFYISFSGIITFKNALDLQDIVKFVPIERILIETDSPYLAPVPKRGKTNEPAYVKYVAEAIANIKNISLEEVAQATTDNFFSLFNKAQRNSQLS